MNARNVIIVCLLVAIVGVLGNGCVSTQGSMRTQRALTVYQGTVRRVRYVEMHVPVSGAGAVAGGLMGALFAATVLGEKREAWTTVAGAMAGAAAGAHTEREHNRRPALELEVELEGGRSVLIVQERDEIFTEGEKVRVVEDQEGRMRVRH